jgi:hypothetical protein
VDAQRAAEIQAVLEGVRLPATREQLVRYAAAEDPRAARELASIGDREYERLDDVGEELAPTQPVTSQVGREPPRPESGLVPGGNGYVTPFPDSGDARADAPPDNPPSKAIEKATETVKKQAQAHGGA